LNRRQRLESHGPVGVLSGEESVHGQLPIERVKPLLRRLDVFPLAGLQLVWRHVQAAPIERAVLMGNQHDSLQFVCPDQEPQLFKQSFLFAEGKEVAGQTSSTAGHHETIAARQPQAGVQEVVDLFSKAAIAAIDCCSANAVLVETNGALVNRAMIAISHVKVSDIRKGQGLANQ
jgi:hypothetical protein